MAGEGTTTNNDDGGDADCRALLSLLLLLLLPPPQLDRGLLFLCPNCGRWTATDGCCWLQLCERRRRRGRLPMDGRRVCVCMRTNAPQATPPSRHSGRDWLQRLHSSRLDGAAQTAALLEKVSLLWYPVLSCPVLSCPVLARGVQGRANISDDETREKPLLPGTEVSATHLLKRPVSVPPEPFWHTLARSQC